MTEFVLCRKDDGRTALSRRQFLRAGTLGLTGLGLAEWLQERVHAASRQGRAKSVIQLWMAGGPSQTDTFDPKPEAGEDYCGPFRNPIEANVSGVRIGELLPNLAKQADKYSIIRSMTHGYNNHETATYVMMTGRPPSLELAYPCLGSVVAFKKSEAAGPRRSLPPYITLTTPPGGPSEAGFLGARYRSFATGGNPGAKDFKVSGVAPARGLTERRLRERRALLKSLEVLGTPAEKEPRLQTMHASQEEAYELILGDLGKVFDLSKEQDAARERYGRNRFGQSCLLARRLVEQGVPFVTVNDGGWDAHSNYFDTMRRKLPILDQAFAALLEDLAERGLLETTAVVWCGEFGRTPRVALEPPSNGGRGHFGACFSAVVAGGGFKGGQVVGASGAKGESVSQRPVYPWDLAASVYQLLGIDPLGQLPHPQGCVARVSPLASGSVRSGGLLTEIM